MKRWSEKERGVVIGLCWRTEREKEFFLESKAEDKEVLGSKAEKREVFGSKEGNRKFWDRRQRK